MKVLQVVHGYPPEFIAGTERYCEAVSKRLPRRGHDCTILAGSERVALSATLAAEEQDGLLVVRYLRVARRQRRWTDEYDPEAEGLARHLLACLNPDVVHLHHWQRLTNNLVAICNDLTIPVVVTLHDVWTSCPRIHRIRWDKEFCEEPPATAPCLTCAERGRWQGEQEIGRALALRRGIMSSELALAAAIIAPSEAHHAFLRTLHGLNGDRFIVLPHGSIPTIPSRRRKRTGPRYPARPLQIGHWGYLMYLKGTHLLLEAVHLLRDPSTVELHLVGTASDQDYESRLRDLSKGISVRFHGAYQPQDLLTFDLDLAIFPSVTCESYSFTLDEAVRLRLPVIVSDRGAPPQRIGGAGLIFRAGNAADLARQIQEILDAPDLLVRMRRNIRPGNLVSMEAHVAMLEKIYEDVAHTRKRRRKSQTPYLKLVAHAQQQVNEREEALAGLQDQLDLAQARARELEADRAQWQADLARLTEERAAEALRAELETRLATLTQELEAEHARWQPDLSRLAEERAAEAQARQAAEAQRAELETRLATLTRVAEERAAEAQARQAAEAQRAELETRLATLTQEREAEHARWQAELTRVAEERAAEAQARQAAEALRAELETRLATLTRVAEERAAEAQARQAAETQRVERVEELERSVGSLTETRDELFRRLTELERTPAARLQAFLQGWNRPKQGKR